MQIQVVSKGIDVSEALRVRIQERVAEAVSKYSHRPGEAFVVIHREGIGFRVDCSVHLPSGVMLQSSAPGGDAYSAAEDCLDRLDKRLRRYKRRMVNRRGQRNTNHVEADGVGAASYVVFQRPDLPEDSGEDADLDESFDEPVVVAETSADLPTLTPGMAALELELADSPVVVFRNAASGSLNVVYRRPDGHIGWIDPERARTAKAS